MAKAIHTMVRGPDLERSASKRRIGPDDFALVYLGNVENGFEA